MVLVLSEGFLREGLEGREALLGDCWQFQIAGNFTVMSG